MLSPLITADGFRNRLLEASIRKESGADPERKVGPFYLGACLATAVLRTVQEEVRRRSLPEPSPGSFQALPEAVSDEGEA